MEIPNMQLRTINGVELEVHDSGGSGEPVVFIHGACGDNGFAFIQESALTGRHRVIYYHRRGYGRSTTEGLPLTIQQQAGDCRAVMQHLGIDRAHMAALSYGGTVLLQYAVDYPESVQTIALMEPGLPSVFAESAEFGEAFAAATAHLESGDIERAHNTCFEFLVPGFRSRFDDLLPAGWYERWIADFERVIFPHDLPELQAWQYTADDAAKITAPVLNVTGARTASLFTDIHETVQEWIPHSERAVVPDASHAISEDQPKASAELLAGFFARHPMGAV